MNQSLSHCRSLCDRKLSQAIRPAKDPPPAALRYKPGQPDIKQTNYGSVQLHKMKQQNNYNRIPLGNAVIDKEWWAIQNSNL